MAPTTSGKSNVNSSSRWSTAPEKTLLWPEAAQLRQRYCRAESPYPSPLAAKPWPE
jgi:hypothetical protein